MARNGIYLARAASRSRSSAWKMSASTAAA